MKKRETKQIEENRKRKNKKVNKTIQIVVKQTNVKFKQNK